MSKLNPKSIMKTRISIIIAAGVCGLILTAPSGFSQGSLTPPGAPAPTMKTLAQIEPRTAISSAPFIITNSGSYYLTTNLAIATGDAITINASGVTLDLNGFTISSTAVSATGTGILLGSGVQDITILNGHIKSGVTYGGGLYSGSGFANGIYLSNLFSPPSNVRVAGVTVSGCLSYGIVLGNNHVVVEACTVQTVGNYGIQADTVSRSSAYPCGSTAISANTASDCSGSCTGGGDGVDAITANNCIGTSTSGGGVNVSAANNCYGYSFGNGTGLFATAANSCTGSSSSGDGLTATTATGSYGYSGGSGYGVHAYNIATGCYGSSTSGDGVNAITAVNSYGVSSSYHGVNAQIANNCYGGNGGSLAAINASIANNCWGNNSANGTGVAAGDIAIGCFGYSSSGTGLFAGIANSCGGGTASGTAENVAHKYNMP
jgi:hypothetical protein